MRGKRIQIIIAYAYHVLFILLGFLLMQSEYDVLQIIAIIAGIIYFLYWIFLNRKGYMPWIIYLHFTIGTIIELILNWYGIIPRDGGFFTGLGQFVYILLLLVHVAALGIVNLILWLIDRSRRKKQAMNSDL